MEIIYRIRDWFRGAYFGSRNSRWSSVRKMFISMHPHCAVCGGLNKLEVHHIKSFHEHPDLELDFDNMIVLCEKYGCHLRFGHLYSYKSWNENIVTDPKIWREKIANRP